MGLSPDLLNQKLPGKREVQGSRFEEALQEMLMQAKVWALLHPGERKCVGGSILREQAGVSISKRWEGR